MKLIESCLFAALVGFLFMAVTYLLASAGEPQSLWLMGLLGIPV